MSAARALRLLAGLVVAAGLASPAARAEGPPDRRPATVEEWIARQDAQLSSGNEEAAILEARTRVEKEKDSAEARYLLGRVYGSAADRHLMAGKADGEDLLERARVQFQGALELDVTYAAAWRGLAKVHRRKKEFETALREARKAHGLDPDSDEGFLLVVTCMYESGDRTGAYATVEAEIKRRPEEAELRVLLATLMAGEGRSREAEAELRLAVAKRPDHVQGQELLVQILASTGRPTEAVAACRAALAASPKSLRLHHLLCSLLLKADDRIGAIAAMEAFARLDLPADLRAALAADLEQLRSAPEGDAETRPLTVEELADRLHSADVLERRRAMQALLEIDHRGVLPPAVVRAVTDPDESVRVYAVQMLSVHGGPAAAGIMEVLLFHPRDRDTSARVRAFATRALGSLRAAAALPVLMRALEEPEPELIRAAIAGIAEVTGKSFVDDPEAPVPQASRDTVRAAYRAWWNGEGGTWWKKRKVAPAVAETGSRRLAKYLVPLLEDGDGELRAAVLDMLATLAGDPVWKALPVGTPEERKAAVERATTWLDAKR